MYIKTFTIRGLNLAKAIATLMPLLLLAGCSNGLDVIDRDFGKSVRMMEQSQIYDMNAANNPSPDGPEGISGNKSLADLYELERPVTAEEQMLNYIKTKKFEVKK
jgi:hypothetical protein